MIIFLEVRVIYWVLLFFKILDPVVGVRVIYRGVLYMGIYGR